MSTFPTDADLLSRSREDACPLCHYGQHDSEHLLSYCPTVRLAWAQLTGGRPTLASFLCHPDLYRPLTVTAACLLHQLTFHTNAIAGCHEQQPDILVRWLVRATRALMRAPEIDIEQEPDTQISACGPAMHSWHPLSSSAVCTHGVASVEAAQIAVLVDSNGLLRNTTPVPGGRPIMVLTSPTECALWPHRVIHGPPPSVRTDGNHNCNWRMWQCPNCRHHVSSLLTLQFIDERTCLQVDRQPQIYPLSTQCRSEFFFDGAVLRTAAGRRAGIGVTMWIAQEWQWRRIGLIHLRIADGSTAAEGETWACTAAVLLARMIGRSNTSCRILGDNVPVLRYAAGMGRIREGALLPILDQAIRELWIYGSRPTWLAIARRDNANANTLARTGCRRQDIDIHTNQPGAYAALAQACLDAATRCRRPS